MVMKLTGIIDGNQIIFERKKGDVWEATIPQNINGIYIVELTAIDEAGNTAYCAKYIVTVDLSALCVRLEQFHFESELLKTGFAAICVLSNYYAKIQNNEYGHAVDLSDYYAEIINSKCGGGQL